MLYYLYYPGNIQAYIASDENRGGNPKNFIFWGGPDKGTCYILYSTSLYLVEAQPANPPPTSYGLGHIPGIPGDRVVPLNLTLSDL